MKISYSVVYIPQRNGQPMPSERVQRSFMTREEALSWASSHPRGETRVYKHEGEEQWRIA